jgi:hypothetical protein
MTNAVPDVCSKQEGTWSSAAGQLYRSVLHSRWADSLQSKVEQRPGYTAQREGTADSAKQQRGEGADARPQAVGLREVGLMLNCSHDAAAAMARRWPGLLQLSAAELQSRLVQMKVWLILHSLILPCKSSDQTACTCIKPQRGSNLHTGSAAGLRRLRAGEAIPQGLP